MTVIRPNSISGINSITANGGDINLFRADGTKADIPTVNNITAGVVTATTFSGNISGATGTFTGNLGVGGVLTYEDVTNIDSVGVITARAAVSIADSIVHTGDTNTSLRFPAADTITAETGGLERFRIASNGQVSISNDGTTDGLLTIKGNSDQVTTPSIRLLDGSDTREVSITNTSGDFVASVHGNDNAIHGHIKMFESGIIDFNNGGASGSNVNRLRIATDGNVTKPNQCSFTAKSTGTWSHGSSTGELDIDINMQEEFDIGGNYNGQIFTAPVAGRYFFSYMFQYKCTSGYLVVYLQKGVSGSYNSYGRMHVYPPQQSSIYTGPGIIGIIDLAAGNTVKPVAEVNYAGNQIANVNFSGYLLG